MNLAASGYIIPVVGLLITVLGLIRTNHLGKVLNKAYSALNEYELNNQIVFCHFDFLKTFGEIFPKITQWNIKHVFRNTQDYETIKKYIK